MAGVEAVIYATVIFAIVCIIYGLVLLRRIKVSTDFLAAGRALPWYAVSMGVALSPLGSGHTIGMMETGFLVGLTGVWFSICFGALFMTWCFYGMGPWIRSLGVTSVPEAFGVLYGRTARRLSSLPNFAFSFCIAGIEIICMSYAVYGLTGLPFPLCIMISTVLSVLYIVFAGLMQMSYLNLLFAIVMYAGMYFGLFWLLLYDLPAKVGITAEQATSRLIEAGQGFKLTMFASPEIITSIVVPMIIFALFGCGSLQMPIQAAFGAKDLAHVRKGLLPAAIVNSLSTIPWAVMGVVASVIPEFAKRGPSFGPIDMLSSVLHPAVLATIMVSLLVANISTSGGHVLAAAIVGTHDIYRGFINPEADDRKVLHLSRLLTIIFSITGGFIAYMLHVAGALIIPNLMWTCALALPGWFLLVYGFWWKRSPKALIYSWVSTWIIVGAWSFIPRSVLVQYVPTFLAEPLNFSLLISFVLTTVLTAVLPGEKGYFRR